MLWLQIKCESELCFGAKMTKVEQMYYLLHICNPLSSAEAPVSKHQRKNRERERWREKTGARGTMGRGKRREPLPDNVFKMAPDFRGRLGLAISFTNTKQDGGTFTETTAGSFLSFRATISIDKRKQ